MINIPLVNQIFVILIITLALWLGFWVYFSNRKNRTHRLFLLMTIFLILWIIFCYLGNTSVNPQTGLFLAKLAYGVVALFFLPFYFFFSFFLGEEKRFPMLNKFAVVICMILFLLTISTDLMAKDMEFTKWGAIPILGIGKFFYFSIILFLSLFITFRLFLNYLKSSKEKKLKLQYFLIGIFIFILMNLITNVIFPFWQRIPQYYYIGNYSAIFLLGFTAFAIVKRELFGIKVVLTQLLVVLIALLLLINFFISETTFEYVWKGGLFVAFCIAGVWLIKSILKEIEQRKRLDKLAHKLSVANIRLEAAYAELKKVDKAKSEFLSMASHQLRTPLTAIKGYLSVILEGDYGKPPEKMEKALENVFQASERLVRIVNDLLNVSRIELGKMETKKEETQIEELIEECYQEMEPQARKKNLNLIFKKPETPLPKLNIDKLKIRQVILNLIDNAIRYTKKGEIEITVEKKENSIFIAVRDTGEGLTKEEEESLFQEFIRGSAGRNLFIEGTGLGLFVAKKYLELHQGKIWAESPGKGKGSTFYVELPIK